MRLLIFVLTIGILFSFNKEKNTKDLDKFMDDWHAAASDADFDNYFNPMSDDFIFLGTAPCEKWTKEEFASFSKPYFDKGKAWDFTPNYRYWNFSRNGKIAWFDEELETWMRDCRGSGILIKRRGKWQIVYYNLTVLIENEKIQEFITLRDAAIEQD